jgi:Bacterial SH3 domain
MKFFLSSALLSLTMVCSTQGVAFSSPKADGYYQCSVYDPTGTPLNIRAKPGGKVIGTIVNGARVGLAAREDSGKWRQIMIGRQDGESLVYGWVFKKYLVDCSSN